MTVLLFGPVGPDFTSFLLVSLIGLLFTIGMAYWVYNDAEQRGNDNAALWALAVASLTILTFFGGFIALAIYLWDRD